MASFLSNGFRSQSLPGWEDRSTITLVGPVGPDGFACNLVVTRQSLPKGKSATDFGSQQVKALGGEVDELSVEDERTTQYNGRELFQRMHRFRVGEQIVRQVQTYLVQEYFDKTIGFVITGTSSPSMFDSAMPAFKLFVENFDTFEPG